MKKSKASNISENIKEVSTSPLSRDEVIIFNSIPAPILTIDKTILITNINKSAERIFGKEIINKYFQSLIYLKDTNGKRISIESLFDGHDISRKEVCFGTDSKSINFLMSASTIKTNDVISGYTIILTDITEQIEAYNEVCLELKEKTFLLKEIHHRIKNNLQIINSILTLQMYYEKNDELTILLSGLQARIRTIALIHEKLYQTDNPSEINICHFLKDLLNILVQVYELNIDSITFVCDIEEIVLETDKVLQIGLITNELITNSVKYAFPSGKGIIFIGFKINGGNYELHIKDDGIGMPEDFHKHKSETLGSQLLETLIEQLNGTAEINTNNGTEYIISFPGS